MASDLIRMISARLGLILLMATSVIAQAEKPSEPNKEMAHIGGAMREIYPLIIKDSAALSSKETRHLRRQVKTIREHVGRLERYALDQPDTFQISYDTTARQLTAAEAALKSNNVAYAQSLLNSVTTLCTSCHTQDQSERFITKDWPGASLGTLLDQANYFYITRAYDRALKGYQDYLAQQETLAWHTETIEVLERTLTIYLQVKRDAAGAERYFTQLLQSKLSDRHLYGEMDAWLRGLVAIRRSGMPTHGVGYAQLQDYMKRYVLSDGAQESVQILSEDKRVSAIWVRSLMHDYLRREPKREEVPQVLYWLAVIDRSLAYDLHYSMANLYLKQCMIGYPRQAIANQCYRLYEDYVSFSYTGSAGTHLPDEIKVELRELRDFLQSAAADPVSKGPVSKAPVSK